LVILFNVNNPSLIAMMLFSVLAAANGQMPPDITQTPPDITDWFKTTPFRVGGALSAPKAIYAPNPEYSEDARQAKLEGTCVLRLVVGPSGKPRDIKVIKVIQTLGRA
jgi:outer membrane biosynthesis protein TonB